MTKLCSNESVSRTELVISLLGPKGKSFSGGAHIPHQQSTRISNCKNNSGGNTENRLAVGKTRGRATRKTTVASRTRSDNLH